MFFISPLTPIFEAILALHDYISFFLLIIFTFVCWFFFVILVDFKQASSATTNEAIAQKAISYQYSSKIVHNGFLEIVWTAIPVLILSAIAAPSFKLLYAMDTVANPAFTLKIVGNQWYWHYESLLAANLINRNAAVMQYIKENVRSIYSIKGPEERRKLRKKELLALRLKMKALSWDPLFLTNKPKSWYLYSFFDGTRQQSTFIKMGLKRLSFELRKKPENWRDLPFPPVIYNSRTTLKLFEVLATAAQRAEKNKNANILSDSFLNSLMRAQTKFFPEELKARIIRGQMTFDDMHLVLRIREVLKAEKQQKYFKVKPANHSVDSYMLDVDELVMGHLRLLETDTFMVLPINCELRFVITASDVLHSFAVPALGIKLDAVPGRLNQFGIKVRVPGIVYGQCSELCGVGHGFMPIKLQFVNNYNLR